MISTSTIIASINSLQTDVRDRLRFSCWSRLTRWIISLRYLFASPGDYWLFTIAIQLFYRRRYVPMNIYSMTTPDYWLCGNCAFTFGFPRKLRAKLYANVVGRTVTLFENSISVFFKKTRSKITIYGTPSTPRMRKFVYVNLRCGMAAAAHMFSFHRKLYLAVVKTASHSVAFVSGFRDAAVIRCRTILSSFYLCPNRHE